MNMASFVEAFNFAVDCFEAGHPSEAETVCRQILDVLPNHPDTLHLLGVVLTQQNRSNEAVPIIRKALAIRGERSDWLSSLGNAMEEIGDLDNAESCHRRATILSPTKPIPWSNLARLLRHRGRLEDALHCARRAVETGPNFAEARINLADALLALEQDSEAISVTESALSLPNLAPRTQIGAHITLATGHHNLRRFDAALDHSLAATRLASELPNANALLAVTWRTLATILASRGDFAESIEAFHKAKDAAPFNPNNLCEIDAEIGKPLIALGRIAEAVAGYDRVLKQRPNAIGTHIARGFALLSAGNYAAGWPAYEHRLQHPRFRPRWSTLAPRLWRGEPLEGRTLLLHAEQGLGDTIQFVRYISLLAQRGARVILEATPPLERLLSRLAGVEQLIRPGEPLPNHDWRCPLLSLPERFDTRLETIPMQTPYLEVDVATVAAWKTRVDAALSNRSSEDAPSPLKIGLIWAGGAGFPADHLRSPGLATLAPLFSLPNVHFYGLQCGDGRIDLDSITPPTTRFTDLGTEICDFYDTAAIMMSMDIVISSCTAPAHLAGALGRTVWIMLSYAPDWRWLLERLDSPWYPTARLFRQKTPGNWKNVVQDIQKNLENTPRE
ncbi:Tetratricopeptide repeat protein [Azospirillaceae bacterium]